MENYKLHEEIILQEGELWQVRQTGSLPDHELEKIKLGEAAKGVFKRGKGKLKP